MSPERVVGVDWPVSVVLLEGPSPEGRSLPRGPTLEPPPVSVDSGDWDPRLPVRPI